ncbi:AraC family transcriptional regulator [Brachybacterium sp. ACRRE]|uniref:helix-turn-helix domain-containing protein n=1 Tax=Brachybacterium sp. ACRRE TaxID=2918184 RepID=UPI001EF304CD|nr:helix-turn-helix domain-containing protein [Brachybacterium sp. ACRRE]MCG7308479.1 helix-turn-helix domain-containing protein [Brachybacterium sp. ACRRE]
MSGNARAAQVPAPPDTTPQVGTSEGRTADGPAWDFANARTGRPPGIDAMVGYRALDVPEVVHRGLPASRLTFILALDAGVEAASGTAGPEGLRRAQPAPVVIGGLHMTSSLVRQRPSQAGIQMSVHPLAARALLGVPAVGLPVEEFDAAGVLGQWAVDLQERVREASCWQERFALVSAGLRQRLGQHDRGPRASGGRLRPELLRAWWLLERSGGRARIGDIAADVGLGPRRLGALFHQELGRSPKQVAGLMRFERAVASTARSVRTTGRADLASIAATSGYADQAHLTREFSRFAGLAPGAWIREEFRNIQDGGHGAAEDRLHE